MNKKILISALIMFWLGLGFAFAESSNIMIIHDIEADAGDIITVELEIVNDDGFVGFNLDVPLPDGFTYVEGTAQLFRSTDHLLSFSINPNNVAKILAVSITLEEFLGNDGVILSFDLQTPGVPGEYLLEIVDPIIGDFNAQDILTGTVDGTVTLLGDEPDPMYTLTLIANPTEGGSLSGAGQYEEGTDVSVSALANTGFEFVNWTDADGNEVSGVADFIYTMPAENVELTANFEADEDPDPDPENIMIINDVSAVAGDIITIELEIQNNEEFVGFNLDIPLPDGFTYIDDSAELFRKTDHMFMFNVIEETNLAKIIAFSITNDAFLGNEGVIFSFDLQTPNTPGDYLFEIIEAVIGNIDAENILTGTVDGTVTLADSGEPDMYNLNLISNPVEAGDLTGAGEYEAGDDVSVVAIANEGWEFVNWTDLDGNLISEAPEFVYTMPANDVTLVANFEDDEIIDPDPENIMKIHDVVADAGDIITIELEIMNADEFVGFNLDIPLPDGFNYVSGTAELFRKTNHQFVFNVIEETNLAKIIAFSITNDAFVGNDGVIFSFDVETPNVPGEYPLEILSAVIGNVEGVNILTGTIDGTVILEEIAEPDNIMMIHDIFADAGDVITVEIEIMNDEEFVGFNLDIPLPAGFNYVDGSAELFRGTDHQFGFNVTDANVAKIIAFSITNDAFVGNDGIVFSFDLTTPSFGGEFELEILDAVIGNVDAQNILTETINGTVFLEGEAEPENIMKIHDIMADAGDVITIELEIMNADEFVGFNLDIPLPDGFNYVSGTAELFRKTNHQFVFNVIEETNLAKIIAFSITNDAFLGNDGIIFSFDVETPNVPGEYDLDILSAVIGNIEGVNILTGTIPGTVILEGVPEPENIMKIHDITAEVGDIITVELEILNDEEFVGFNLDIPLPAGFSYVDGTAELFRGTDHDFAFNVIEGNIAKIIAFSITNDAFLGNEGVVFSFDLETPNEPGEYLLEIVDGVIGNIDAEDILTGTIDGTVILEGEPIEQYSLTLLVNPEDAGVVTGEGNYIEGEEVFITAEPNTGFIFVDWTDIDGNLVSDEAEFTYIMPAEDVELTANFELDEEPDPENIMKIHDIVADAGDIITIELEIMNDEEFVGFNLDIPLPDGFNYVSGTAELFRKTNHQFVFNVIEETNLAKIIAFSITNDAFIGNDGIIFSFDVETPNVPGEYDLDILSAVIGNIEGINILTGTIPGTVTLEGEIEPENIMKIHDIVADAGDVITIELEIMNDEEFVGFNLDIPLPDGFNYVSGTAELFRKTNHQFVFNVIEETNLAKIIAFSITNDAFIGNDGIIFSFDVETPNVPGEYDLDILSAVIGNIDGINILTGTIPGTVTLEGEPIGENIMKIHDITATAGDVVTVELEIMNDDEFVGFNLRIPLPEGFSYIDGTAELFRKTDHQLVFNVTPDNIANILAFSITNDAFLGNDGVIFSFDVETSNIPGEYLLEITDAIIGDIDAQNILTGTIDGTVVLTPPDEPFTLTLIANPEEGGEVTGAGEYFAGEDVEVDAIPNDGWEFINWTDEDGNVVSEDAFNVIEMPAEDLTLIANFELIAEPENIMKIHDIEAEGGDIITIELEIMNDEEFVGFNLEIPLPDGFEYVDGTAELFRKTNHQFAFNIIEGNLARIIAFSITNDEFLGNDGVIFSFDVTTPFVEGEFPLEIHDAIIGNIDAENIITGTIDGTVILTMPHDLFELTLIANPEEGGTVTGAGNYFAGDEVEVDAIPNEGWAFVNWTDEDGNVVSDDAFNVIEMPAADLTLIANFEMVDYTLTLVANPEEGGEVTGAGVYNFGDEVEVDAIPNEGWVFVNWTDEDGNVVSEDAFNVIEMPAADLTLIANFEMAEYTLTLIANPEEGGEVTGAGVYNFGDEVEVDAIPNEGWVFVNWTDEDGNVVSEDAFNVIEMPAADLTLIANFEMVEYTLTLIASPEEGGEVTGAGVYNFGDEVEVDAIPNEGWVFVNWTDEDGNVVSEDAFNIIEMPAADLTLIANFEMAEYTLTLIAEPAEGGEVTGAGVYNFGDEVEVDAIPNEGWVFVNWTDEDGNVVSEEAFNIIVMPAQDLTLIATFELDISIEEVHVLDLNIFPNPASSVMNVESNLVISSLRLIDMLGQVVYHTTVDDTTYELHVSGFRNGVYFIQVNTSQGLSTHRVQIVN